MEVAKAVLYVSLLTALFAVFAWYMASARSVRVDDAQAFIADVCWLLDRPENTSISRIYSLESIAVEDGRIVSAETLAPQCSSFVFNGTHYIYNLPVRVSGTLVFRGSVRLVLARRGGGVWVSKG